MQRRQVLRTLASSAAAAAIGLPQSRSAAPPNIVFILADDLGYGDLGCFGQKVIQTPNLDRMASEGLRFTQFYAGNTVCAPSRCVLMTGRHMGHGHVRGNASSAGNMIIQSLRASDVTVAETLKKAGYSTALIGKWGLGEIDEPGHPLNKGFDYFYGYLNQVHAHNFYPEFLWRNREQVKLSNVVQKASRAYGGFQGGWATTKKEYSHDLFLNEALNWIDKNKSGPFFLYFASTLPHANNEGGTEMGNGSEVPSLGQYAQQEWPEPDKGQAAMVTYLDTAVGRLLEHLKKLGLAENTLVMFSSDNGPHMESRNNPLLFNPAGPLRGMKRDLYEGGIRVPTIAWWPGTIQPNRTSDHIAYFGDIMATFSELARTQPPAGLDSISFVPTLRGQADKQRTAEYLYWEFYEGGSMQAVRWGKWKGIRKPLGKGSIELYDLSADPGEKYNVARGHADVVKRIEGFMREAHVPHPNWKVPPSS